MSSESVQRVLYGLMFVLTAAYLIVELGFNARLLDVVGGLPKSEEISAIEKWGRTISGIALSLAVWGTVLLPLAAWIKVARALLPLLCTVTACICLSVAWVEERRLIEKLVADSNGEMRRTALQLRLISAAALNGNLPIGDIDLGRPDARPPSTKAFLAVFPGFVLQYPRIRGNVEALMRDPRMIAAIGNTAPDIPTAAEAWRDTIAPAFAEVRAMFERDYSRGNADYQKALASIPSVQADRWDRYIQQLEKNGFTPESASAVQSSVVSALRENNLIVPSDWNPADKQTFYDAIAARVRNDADEKFSAETQKALGAKLPPGLSWQQFCQAPAIVARFQQKLHTTASISCDVDYDRFSRSLYSELVVSNASSVLSQALRPANDFEDGQPAAEIGKRAMEGVIVPPIALGFSLLGAIVHIYKVMRYLILAFAADADLLIAAPLFTSAALVLYPLVQPNSLTSSAGYRRVEDVKKQEPPLGPPLAIAFRWVINMQNYAYPLNEEVRSSILGNTRFDSFPIP